MRLHLIWPSPMMSCETRAVERRDLGSHYIHTRPKEKGSVSSIQLDDIRSGQHIYVVISWGGDVLLVVQTTVFILYFNVGSRILDTRGT